MFSNVGVFDNLIHQRFKHIFSHSVVAQTCYILKQLNMNYLLQEFTQFKVWSQMESQDRGEVVWDPWNLVSNPKSPPNIALIQSAAHRMHPCANRIQTHITEQIKGKIHRNDLELYHRCNMQSTEQNKTSPWRNASRVCMGAVKSNIITLLFFHPD